MPSLVPRRLDESNQDNPAISDTLDIREAGVTNEPKGPRNPKEMADPKLVLEADPDDLVLESIAPDAPEAGSAPQRPVPPPPAVPTSPQLARPSLPGRGPVLPVPRPTAPGPLPPVPGSAPKHDRPAPPQRAAPASGVTPRQPSPTAVSSSSLETIPAPARDSSSARIPAPSNTNPSERSSVTARDVGASRGAVVPPLPASRTAGTNPAIPARPSSVQRPSNTELGSAPRLEAPAVGVVSGQFSVRSYPGAAHQQSALVRLLSPFIEDPRPRWLLAMYFILGVALGVGAAFGLWGQH